MKFLLVFLALVGARSAESVLKCWECQSEHGFHPFECDHINEGRSVDCTSPRAGWNPFALRGSGPRIRETATLTFGSRSFVAGWIEQDWGCHRKTACASRMLVQIQGQLQSGGDSRPRKSGEVVMLPSTNLLALLTFGIIIIQLGKLRFNLLLLLIGLVTTSGFPVGSEALQCKTGYEADSNSIICNGTNPFCYIRMIDAYQPEEPRIYKGCLEEKEFTPERRHQGLNNHCIVDHTRQIDVWCYCNDKDDCNMEAINEVGNRDVVRFAKFE
ncbi:hypothetical protein Ocin01_16517, partial [Orchesella cincta]